MIKVKLFFNTSAFILILIFSANSFAVECGTYQFSGTVRLTKKYGHQLVMKEKSHSEIRLNVPNENLLLFISYLDKYINGEIQVDENEHISNPKNIKLTTPDPLELNDNSAFKLINKDNCKKN